MCSLSNANVSQHRKFRNIKSYRDYNTEKYLKVIVNNPNRINSDLKHDSHTIHPPLHIIYTILSVHRFFSSNIQTEMQLFFHDKYEQSLCPLQNMNKNTENVLTKREVLSSAEQRTFLKTFIVVNITNHNVLKAKHNTQVCNTWWYLCPINVSSKLCIVLEVLYFDKDPYAY